MLTENRTVRQMSFKERMSLHRHLSTVLNKPDKEGKVSYTQGWSDERVASVFKIGVQSVRRFRQAEFGQLIASFPDGTSNPAVNFMMKTNRRLEAIEAALGIIVPDEDKTP